MHVYKPACNSSRQSKTGPHVNHTLRRLFSCSSPCPAVPLYILYIFVKLESLHLARATAVHNIYNLQASRSPNLCTSSFAITESLHFKRHDHRIFAPRSFLNCRGTTRCLAVGPPLKRHSHKCRGTPTQQASSGVVGPPLKRHTDNCRGIPTQETTLLNICTPTLCAHSVPTQVYAHGTPTLCPLKKVF